MKNNTHSLMVVIFYIQMKNIAHSQITINFHSQVAAVNIRTHMKKEFSLSNVSKFVQCSEMKNNTPGLSENVLE